jgi:glutamate dehydrogenase (NADP+)
VDAKPKRIMENICRTANETTKGFGVPGNLVIGANIAELRKVVDAMLDQGMV